MVDRSPQGPSLPLVAGILAGLLSGVAAGIWAAQGATPVADPGALSPPPGTSQEEALATATAGPVRQEAPPDAPEVADPTLLQDGLQLGRRVRALEQTVADLAVRVGGLGPMPTDLEGVLLALQDKNLVGHGVGDAQRERRMALNRWLVEHAPEHPQAAGALDMLVGDELLAHGAEHSLATLDRLAPRVGLVGWPYFSNRANMLGQMGRHAEARQIYLDRQNSPDADDNARASAMFWRAYSFQQEGRYPEAQAIYRELIARYKDSGAVGVGDSVGGAENQLVRIARWQREK